MALTCALQGPNCLLLAFGWCFSDPNCNAQAVLRGWKGLKYVEIAPTATFPLHVKGRLGSGMRSARVVRSHLHAGLESMSRLFEKGPKGLEAPLAHQARCALYAWCVKGAQTAASDSTSSSRPL